MNVAISEMSSRQGVLRVMKFPQTFKLLKTSKIRNDNSQKIYHGTLTVIFFSYHGTLTVICTNYFHM